VAGRRVVNNDAASEIGKQMTDIEAKALALVNEVSDERAIPRWTTFYRKENGFVEALCRAIEQHEAFRQEVSDAVEHSLNTHFISGLNRFIIPKPKPKPDPLEEVLTEIDHAAMWVDKCAEEIRAALGERGWEIREKGQ